MSHKSGKDFQNQCGKCLRISHLAQNPASGIIIDNYLGIVPLTTWTNHENILAM